MSENWSRLAFKILCPTSLTPHMIYEYSLETILTFVIATQAIILMEGFVNICHV